MTSVVDEGELLSNEEVVLIHRYVKQAEGKVICRRYLRTGTCITGQEPSRASESSEPPICTKVDGKCMYYHVDRSKIPFLLADAVALEVSGRLQGDGIERTARCKNIAVSGYCRFGAKCKFQHPQGYEMRTRPLERAHGGGAVPLQSAASTTTDAPTRSLSAYWRVV